MRPIRNFFRFVGDACSSICRNPLMTIASVMVVMLCLFIFGVFIILTMNANYLGHKIEEQCQIEINISHKVGEGDPERKAELMAKIENEIQKKSTKFSSLTHKLGEDRYDNFIAGLTEDEKERFEGVPSTVVGDSFVVTLNDISKADQLVSYFENMNFGDEDFDGIGNPVTSVNSEQELMDKIRSVTGFIKKISIWIVAVFAVISVFIISNTIKLTLYSRRKEINIMKYVGATDIFIRGPFVVEGMIVGLLAAAVAYIVTAYGYAGLKDLMSSFALSSNVFSLEPFAHMRTVLITAYAAIGIGLGALGSYISIRRYLKV